MRDSSALQTGADVMKRIAAPMTGGVIYLGNLGVAHLPCDLCNLAATRIGDQTEGEAPLIPTALIPSGLKMNR